MTLKTTCQFLRLRRKHAENVLIFPRMSLSVQGKFGDRYLQLQLLLLLLLNSHIQEMLNVSPLSLIFSLSLHLDYYYCPSQREQQFTDPIPLSCPAILFSLYWKESTVSTKLNKEQVSCSSLPPLHFHQYLNTPGFTYNIFFPTILTKKATIH